ncbi:MAG: glutamine--fructose-6-phosphate transaminase (isomerizing) [Propionibacteriaceae bacterium]|jgi:glucosamine--fructose-6-phosphate aminotransferase (isomerizing)|nr:glutamine--fructose-6-phosphate transaminase (isomerizing) [Propionibacteriaceae bacterium]
MCGIIGYVGPRVALDVAVAGLKRMEYRGYDSAGVAVIVGDHIELRKKAGKIANLEAELAARPIAPTQIAIGHTRWATHGGPTDENAHPHISANGRVALIHNGIIENFATLRQQLEAAGVPFQSKTDTEVAAQLLGREVEAGADLADAMRTVCRLLDGAFTLVALDVTQPGRLVAARRNSPLVVGVGEGENFVASDVAAFIEFTRSAIELGQDQVVDLDRDQVTITDFAGRPAQGKPYEVTWDLSAAEKSGYDWFMRKEIFEQPRAVADTLLGRFTDAGALKLDELHISEGHLRAVDKIIIVACGTAYYAGLVAKYAIEHWTRVACEVEIASEFRYRDPIITGRTLVVTISQSGETADTLMAIRHAREQGARIVAICNTNGSTIPRESDAVIYTHAGPEIGVASTKGFITQLAACYLLGLYLAQIRGTMFGDEIAGVMRELAATPPLIQKVLDTLEPMRDLAKRLAGKESFLFLGRHVGYPIAMEGALKLKEIAYVHAEGFAAGELKHGPIALVDKDVPVFIIVPPMGRDRLHDKVVSNIEEVRARGAHTIVLAEEGDLDVAPHADTLFRLPRVSTILQPLVSIVPLQFFACELATLLGYDVDQPRNLAKSVTVE